MNSTPTPTPAPTPTPTTRNDDLIGPLITESFANDSTRATATFSSGETTQGTVANQTATIRYNADSDSYTLTTGGGSITFGPADIDASQSNSAATVYVRNNSSSNVDSLTLTKAGTSGRVTYQYVGSAFWQHSQVGTSSGSGSIDAYVYGVPTAANAVPRTGSAYYDVDLIGAETIPTGVAALSGEGGALVAFDAGKILISGTMNGVYTVGNDTPFNAEADLSATTNGFSGTFSYSDAADFVGSMQGRFFGPASDEIGATFNASASDGRVAIGTITGRKGAIGNNEFTNGGLTNSQIFTTSARRLDFRTATGALNSNTVGDFTNQASSTESVSLAYNAATGLYTLTMPDTSATSTRLFSESQYNDGGDQLVLHSTQAYSAAGYWQRVTGGTSGNPLSYRLESFVYGMPTDNAALVRTGSAGFSLSFSGKVIDNDYANALLVSGSGTFVADLGTGLLQLNGSLALTESWILSGRPRFSTTSTLSGTGTISSSANSFSGSLTFDSIGNYSGTFSGNFFGPSAEEVGAIWSASDGADRAVGTFLGQNDPTILAAQQTLAGLAEQTVFPIAIVAEHVQSGSMTYDPATQTYTVALVQPYIFDSETYTMGPANIDAANSNSERTWYTANGTDTTVSGYISKPGDANPVFALTYSSFGDMNVVQDSSAHGSIRNFLVFGLNTPEVLRPHSGSATYTGIVRGHGEVGPLGYVGDLSGSSTLSANFGDGTVAMQINVSTAEATQQSVGQYTFDGQIASNGFFGNGPSGLSGSFQGDFFGPNVDEFGAAWKVYDPLAMGGITNIHGVAVGRKN